MDENHRRIILKALPLFSLGEVVKTFENCQCTVLSAKRHNPHKIEVILTWADTHEEITAWILVQQASPRDTPWVHAWAGPWEGFKEFHKPADERSPEYIAGCYLPEVIGQLCRIWATG